MKNILFVCLGNICRSPMAEYVFRDMAAQRGIQAACKSAGTSGWHNGETMHCGTADILDGMNIDSRDFVSSQVPDDCMQVYDYVLVMDDNNLRDMQKRFGKNPHKLFKITDLLPENSPHDHVPDPWYTGNFVQTREIVSQCCAILCDKLQKGEM
ncbi:low molecular weight protein-tyrosine-phosphatase [Alysiella filiformis]|uniref:protein-tyrosine-phosphatase n=1 Tax=Alysiella filiformis DSM 16848 TaxID=1120981 RepID=A0A286EEI5_9NEIS|nr:low molecular weight protein-tyrosine-phosphatase [Alysiella filiformis]QMT31642.1 low molecular weight phosphotyrosine protein phosphatase [Alysiella filiformis]UBQ55347.1 low molecular weight phosphotyrosine protein phosphatase [Alysiella filiformis DSM 16848]SOD69326.1 protein-tyrosine phosphatase [Alysiella filiformis DSM 16848]